MTRFHRVSIFILILSASSSFSVGAAKLQFAEQFYKLYHLHMNRGPQDSAENIWYLSMALRAPFANPLNALAKIENKNEWEKYRNVFVMHIYLKITDEYLAMASKYDKSKAYFYNYPWKYVNLDSLKTAESYYNLAMESWEKARYYAGITRESRFRWIYLDALQYWEDEAFRIENGELNYRDIINRHLTRLNRVREVFKNMDYETY